MTRGPHFAKVGDLHRGHCPRPAGKASRRSPSTSAYCKLEPHVARWILLGVKQIDLQIGDGTGVGKLETPAHHLDATLAVVQINDGLNGSASSRSSLSALSSLSRSGAPAHFGGLSASTWPGTGHNPSSTVYPTAVASCMIASSPHAHSEILCFLGR